MSTALYGQVAEKDKGPCATETILKARTEGYHSLSLSEKVQFTLDLRKCEPKNLRTAIKKEVNQKQIEADAKEAETFVGKTSSFAYCVIAVVLYWAFV